MKKYCLIILGIILTALMLTAGCGGAPVAKSGDTVKVHYTGTLIDGTQFDSSAGGEPLQFTIGAGQVIPGFEKGVTGMKVGEKKTITIPAADAYGEYRNDLVIELEKSKLQLSVTPEIGMQLTMTQADGAKINVTIKAISETMITLDANAPLAGNDLTFALELVEIVKK
jgi:FKBP-type peptidyl-prolyl cis-trans isomerase 2